MNLVWLGMIVMQWVMVFDMFLKQVVVFLIFCSLVRVSQFWGCRFWFFIILSQFGLWNKLLFMQSRWLLEVQSVRCWFRFLGIVMFVQVCQNLLLLCWFKWQCSMMKLCIDLQWLWFWWLYLVIFSGLKLWCGKVLISLVMFICIRCRVVDFSGLMKLVDMLMVMMLCVQVCCCMLVWNLISCGLVRVGVLRWCSSMVVVLLLFMCWLEQM